VSDDDAFQVSRPIAACLELHGPLLAAGGMVYAEAEYALETEAPPAWLDGWQIVRADQAGMVFYHVLQGSR